MKRLVLFFAIITSVCIFAASVNAVTGSNSDAFGEVTYVSGINEDTKIQDKSSRVVLKNSDGTYTTYPAYYISDIELQWQGTVQYRFDVLNNALGTSYDMDSIIRLEILADSTVMNQSGGEFQNRKNLKEVAFPPDTQMKKICMQQFKSSGLEKIHIPATVKEIDSHIFEACASLKEVTFDEGFSMTSLPAQMFTGCTSLEKISIPNSVETIGRGFFGEATSLKEIRFGEKFVSMGEHSLALCANNMIIYAPSTFLSDMESVTTNLFTYDSGNLHTVTLFFSGTREQAQALIDKSSHRGLTEAKLVEWDGGEDSAYIPQSPTAWTIVYSYKICSHRWGEKEQAEVVDFYSDISVGLVCTKCQIMNITKKISPIFECVGNSVTESPDVNGKYHMIVGYKVNDEAYEQYKAYGTLDFGFVICFADVVGKAPLTVSSGKVTPKSNAQVLITEKSEFPCDFYDVKMGGLTAKINGRELVMCMYVFDGKTVSYLLEYGQSDKAEGTIINIK